MYSFKGNSGLLLAGLLSLGSVACEAPLNETGQDQANQAPTAHRQQRGGGGGGGCYGEVPLLCRENRDTYCSVTSYWAPTDQTILTCETTSLVKGDRCELENPIDPTKVASIEQFVINPKVTVHFEPVIPSTMPLERVIFDVAP